MNDIAGDNVVKIRTFLNDQRFKVEEEGDSLNVIIDSSHLINIYALQRDSDYFWASFETRVADQRKRHAEVTKAREILSKGLLGLAGVDEFKQTQEIDGRFVYVADVELDQSLIYRGVITIGEEAVIAEKPSKKKEKAAAETAKSLEEDEIKAEPEAVSIDVEEIEVVEEDIDLTDAVEIKPPSSPLEEAMEQLETIDAKMLRKILDMMNLKRSSNIRLVLTRIVRSTGDIVEFKQAIINEAKKITSDDDQEELRIVKAVSTSGFLEPVVNLLCDEVFKDTKNRKELPKVS